MAYTVTNRVMDIRPLMKKHGLSLLDWAVLYSIGDDETGKMRDAIIAGEMKETTAAWCRTSLQTIAHEWALDFNAVKRSALKLEKEGFIFIAPTQSKRDANRRKVNLEKIDQLIAELPEFEAAYKEKRFGKPEVEVPPPEMPSLVEAPKSVVMPITIAPTVVKAHVVVAAEAMTSAERVIKIAEGYEDSGVPTAPDPGTIPIVHLMVLLYNYCGRPSRLNGAQEMLDIITALNPLKKQVGFERVRDVMAWVFTEDTAIFGDDQKGWADRITSKSDPAKFFAAKFSNQIEMRYLSAQKGKRKAKCTPASHPAVIPFTNDEQAAKISADVDADEAARAAAMKAARNAEIAEYNRDNPDAAQIALVA